MCTILNDNKNDTIIDIDIDIDTDTGIDDTDTGIDDTDDVKTYDRELCEEIIQQHIGRLLYIFDNEYNELTDVESKIIEEYNKIVNNMLKLMRTQNELNNEIDAFINIQNSGYINKQSLMLQLASKFNQKLFDNITSQENRLKKLLVCKDLLTNIFDCKQHELYYVKECNKNFMILIEINIVTSLRKEIKQTIDRDILIGTEVIYLDNKNYNNKSDDTDKINILYHNIVKPTNEQRKLCKIPNIKDYAKIIVSLDDLEGTKHAKFYDVIVQICQKDIEAATLLCRVEYTNDTNTIKIGSYLEITYDEIFYSLNI
ncbi:MAG: hypothetical protein Terrestrivirus5_161 [Terrestrivirus sp.]|uniref:Uncharacterized protein n=1 Tax=Terrestrivirus sp. TaxID=2487775 RepID=A0A3G4ZSC5_9VIRU|nr:MAG: hypothetical protein Terrestrivirus5_161 [Terrestrivirus sp.]